VSRIRSRAFSDGGALSPCRVDRRAVLMAIPG
jgi:hypothetical protein